VQSPNTSGAIQIVVWCRTASHGILVDCCVCIDKGSCVTRCNWRICSFYSWQFLQSRVRGTKTNASVLQWLYVISRYPELWFKNLQNLMYMYTAPLYGYALYTCFVGYYSVILIILLILIPLPQVGRTWRVLCRSSRFLACSCSYLSILFFTRWPACWALAFSVSLPCTFDTALRYCTLYFIIVLTCYLSLKLAYGRTNLSFLIVINNNCC